MIAIPYISGYTVFINLGTTIFYADSFVAIEKAFINSTWNFENFTIGESVYLETSVSEIEFCVMDNDSTNNHIYLQVVSVDDCK